MSEDWLTTGVTRMARIVRWALVVAVALLMVIVNLAVLSMGSIGVCKYDLTVQVGSASTTPIKDVRGMAFYEGAEAEKVVANPNSSFESSDDDGGRAFRGDTLKVDVWYESRSYCFGLLDFDESPRFLVLIVDYQDGKRANRLVNVPHHSVARAVTVEVP